MSILINDSRDELLLISIGSVWFGSLLAIAYLYRTLQLCEQIESNKSVKTKCIWLEVYSVLAFVMIGFISDKYIRPVYTFPLHTRSLCVCVWFFFSHSLAPSKPTRISSNDLLLIIDYVSTCILAFSC